MGVLGVSGAGDGSQHIDPPEAEATETATEGGDQQARNEAGQFVPAEKLQPETAASRRERQWQERVSNYVKPIEERLTGEVNTYKQQLEEERRQRAEQAQALARLQGQIEAMQRQPATQPQAQQPQGPDPAELRRKAREALRADNIDEYERLHAEANEIIADRKAEARVKAFQQEFQKNLPPQVPPHIQSLLYQSPNVAAAGDKGIATVVHLERGLELGLVPGEPTMPPGYARTQRAFQLANESLGPKKTTPPAAPAYSRESASALSGVPTGRPGPSAARGEGVRLNAAQEAAMKAGGFKDAEEYLKWTDPHKYGMVRQ